ncbi:MAG: TerC family protein [Acidobacteriaceae bacterium]
MPSPTPLSHWLGFHLLLLVLLSAEFLYARRRANRPPLRSEATEHRTSLVSTILWVGAALGFSAFVYLTLGPQSTTEYLAGYAIEESLSIDNLFLFLLLFRLFRIEPTHQPRVLFWGVAGAIVMRGAFIAAGIGLLERFHWVSYVFGVFLLLAAIRLLIPEEKGKAEELPRWIRWLSRIHPVSLRQDAFFVVEGGQRMATMLMLALLAIEVTDVVFALDSIPAVLSITRHPFLAYTSNIMAVMGLRSLYFLLAKLLSKLRLLHYGLAAVLAFAAFKMLASRWIEIGPLPSLGVIIGLLGVTVSLSLRSPIQPN